MKNEEEKQCYSYSYSYSIIIHIYIYVGEANADDHPPAQRIKWVKSVKIGTQISLKKHPHQ